MDPSNGENTSTQMAWKEYFFIWSTPNFPSHNHSNYMGHTKDIPNEKQEGPALVKARGESSLQGKALSGVNRPGDRAKQCARLPKELFLSCVVSV